MSYYPNLSVVSLNLKLHGKCLSVYYGLYETFCEYMYTGNNIPVLLLQEHYICNKEEYERYTRFLYFSRETSYNFFSHSSQVRKNK